MKVEVQDLVTVIRGLGNKFEYFHLSQCICGAPMWQQPCRICGYYPTHNDDRIYQARTGKNPHERARNSCTKKNYAQIISISGNIFEYYLRGFHYCMDPEYAKLNAARELAKSFTWPTADEVWDHYRKSEPE